MAQITIEAFLFDLGRVLLQFDHQKGFQQVADLSGIDVRKVAQMYQEKNWQQRYEIGAVTTPEIIAELRALATTDFTESDFIGAAGDIFEPMQGTIDLVRQLHGQGKKLCIVSNTCDAHMRYCIKAYDFFRYFPRRIFSHEVGVAKPDPKFYHLAAEAVGEAPEACLFIDDLPENVAGAKAFGMQAHHFTSSEVLQKELELLRY